MAESNASKYKMVEEDFTGTDAAVERMRSQPENAGKTPEYRPDGSISYSQLTDNGTTFRYPLNSASHSSRIVFFINHYTSGKLGAEQGYNEKFTQRKYEGLGNNLAQNMATRGAEFAGYAGKLAQVQGGVNFEEKWSTNAMNYIPQKKRLNKTISLYMPHAFQTSYGMNYSEIEMGGLTGQIISDVASGKGLGEALENLGTNAVKTTLSRLASNAIGAASTKFNAESVEKVLNKSLGRIENPRKEVTFEGQEIRKFQFQFMFAPKTPNESIMVMDIINTFKLHMHPELIEDGNGMYITYPDDFDIQFMYRDPTGAEAENPFINKVLTCVLENLAVDYAPTGHWSTFADGSPTHIALQLQFREIEPLHRKMIVEGF